MDKNKCFTQSSRLTIKYSGPGWTILDDELIALLAQYGLELTGSGYNLTNGQRDLVFHRVKLTPQEWREQYLGEFSPEES